MRTALIYVAIASVGTLSLVIAFMILLMIIFPSLNGRINGEGVGRATGFIIMFIVIPASATIGFKRQSRKEDEHRSKPVKEIENLRPLNLKGIRSPIKKSNK